MAKSYYAVTADAVVYRCRSVKEAGNVEGAVIASDTNMNDIPTPVLVKLHNLARPERPVTRFSDRATALKRLEGVLDLLAKPLPGGETAAPSASEPASKEKRAPKAPKAPKEPREPKKRGAKPKEIPEELVRKTMELRAKKVDWYTVCDQLGQPRNFIFRVRPLMRLLDPSSVKNIGPGSPNYGKGPKPRPKREPGAPRAKRQAKAADRGVPVEAF
jgi:hypothetical protein